MKKELHRLEGKPLVLAVPAGSLSDSSFATVRPDLLKEPAIVPDSHLLKGKVPTQAELPSYTFKNPLPKTDSAAIEPYKKIRPRLPKGTVSAGYDYGFLPYTSHASAPSSAFKTEGRLETDLFKLPLDISYFYTTQKNLIGLNNYFRIGFSAERYREGLRSGMNEKLALNKAQLGQLQLQRQELLQKMAYADYLNSTPPDKWPLAAKAAPAGLPDSVLQPAEPATPLPMPDSATVATSIKDSLRTVKGYSKADSLQRQALLHQQQKDSVLRAYQDYKEHYEQVNDSIRQVQKKIAALESLAGEKPSYTSRHPYLSKTEQVLSGIQKFDVGLCYPAYSTFLANNIPIRGVNFEYQRNKRFVAFTYGTTISTVLYDNRTAAGLMQSLRNTYSSFDANNLSGGRKVLALKFGAGEKEGDHAFAGFLIGKGAQALLPAESSQLSRSVESNLVLEADLRKKLSPRTTLDVVVGKSSIQEEDLNLQTLKTAAREVFSAYRSYAALVSLKTSLAKTRTGLVFSVRWVDPFFRSFGVGFMRSDNLRYEVKLDQPITKSIKYSGIFRREEDNLLQLLNYKNTFTSFNNSMSFRITRGLSVRGSYTPLSRRLNSGSYDLVNRNTILTGLISYSPRSRHVETQLSLLYSDYHVHTDSNLISFKNLSYQQQLAFKSGFKTSLNVSWFESNLKDSTDRAVYLAVLDLGYSFKNGSSVGAGGKGAYKADGSFYPGFTGRVTVALRKGLFWQLQAEKFIVGELFNGYDLDNLKKFPYCFTTKLILTL